VEIKTEIWSGKSKNRKLEPGAEWTRKKKRVSNREGKGGELPEGQQMPKKKCKAQY